MGFGGNNGLTDFKDILGFNVQAATTRAGLFSASALMLALGVFVTWRIVSSKYGKLLIAVRDAESRTRFLGWRAENVKLFAFTVSAVMAGIAGALYVPQVGIINPGEFEPGNSIEVVIWTAVGGRATIVGPIVGAVLVNTAKSWFTGALPEFWLFALGGLFVAVTLFLPKGIVGLWDQWRNSRRDRARPPRSRERPAERAAVTIVRAAPKPGDWTPPGAAPNRSRRSEGAMSRNHTHPLSRRRLGLLRRLPRHQQSVLRASTRARCGPSSAPTAPARRR